MIKYSLAQLGEETLVCGREINAMEVLKHSHSWIENKSTS